jgi:phosphatidylserine synthase 2
MASQVDGLHTSPVEESDPDALFSPPEFEPEPGLNGTPVRCE